MNTPTLKQLRDEFERIQHSHYQGVAGIQCFESKIKGPTLGITINTHGDEPSGLAASWHLRRMLITRPLERGRVLIVMNNPKATARYFNAKGRKAKQEARYIDTNMNRLPANVMRTKSKDYEILRAQELQPIWKQFEYGFDIHSTRSKVSPMIIVPYHLDPKLIQGFPIETIITKIVQVQINKPAIAFYGSRRHSSHMINIEAGPDEASESFRCAITCAEALLVNLGLLSAKKSPNLKTKNYLSYEVGASVIFLDKDKYRLQKSFLGFESIKKGQILAHKNKEPIRAPFDGHVLFGKKIGDPIHPGEEILFLTRRPKKIRA